MSKTHEQRHVQLDAMYALGQLELARYAISHVASVERDGDVQLCLSHSLAELTVAMQMLERSTRP